MVHQPPYSLDAPIALKIGLVQLLVVLCDTHCSHGLMMIISPWNSRSHLETATRFGIRHMILLRKMCMVRRICVLLGCAKNYLDTLDFSDGAKNLGCLATGRARARKKNASKFIFSSWRKLILRFLIFEKNSSKFWFFQKNKFQFFSKSKFLQDEKIFF